MATIRSRAAGALPLFRKSVYALAVAAAFGAAPVLAATGDPLTTEILVNTTITDEQRPRGVAMDAAGDFVVTWTSANQDGDGYGAYARVFHADGTPVTSEIQVNTTTVDRQDSGGVAMDASGNFVVTWNSNDQDGYGYGAYARVFHADGTPATSEIQVNTTTENNQRPTAVAMDAAGDFVVTWSSYGQDGDGYGAYARVFQADGTPATSEIQVNSTTASHQGPLGVAMGAAGDFVVTWASFNQDSDSYGAYARVFQADGTPATTEIQVNTIVTASQIPAGVAMDSAGEFVVTWRSYGQDGDGYGTYARVFHTDGTPATAEIPVNTFLPAYQVPAGVAMDAAGDFAVTWRSTGQDTDGYGTYARVFHLNGTPVTAEIQVNSTTVGGQVPTGVAMDADGNFVVTWIGNDGGRAGAYVRKFAGIPLPPVDLSLTQSGNANPVTISTSAGLTYSLTAHNNSTTDAASSLVLTETLGTGLTYNTFSSGDAWSCSAVAQVVTCNLGTLAAATTSTVDITVDSGAAPGSVKTTGNVSATNSDPVPANNNKNVTTLLCDPSGIDAIGFGATSFAASEGSPVTITVNRSGPSCSNATVHYATVAGGSAPASDFTATSGDFTWLPLDANKKTFVVPIANDAVYTGNRTVNLALSSPSSNASLTKSTSLINIKDDEVPLTIGLSTSDQSVSEEGGVATVTATLSATRSQSTTVPLSITGTANKVKDYTLSATSITIASGNLSGSVTLTGLHDLLDETDETAIVKLNPVSGVTSSGATTNTITFTDDDATPTVSFDAASSTRAESKTNSVNLVLSAVSGQDVTVNVSSTGGTATAGADYTINGSGTVTIPAGAISATAVTLIDDAAHESSETAIFHIDSATHATPSGIQTTTLTITDNDP